MKTLSTIRLSTRLRRKDPSLPVYVVIASEQVRPWQLTGTTVVEGSANGEPLGRRTIKPWGRGRDAWFVELTAAFCRRAGLDVGDPVELELRLADTSTPEELERLLTDSASLRAAWSALSESERRGAGEHIRAGKAAATRDRRAASVVASLRRGSGRAG